MRHTIAQQFVVHLVRSESLGERFGYLRHVFEEVSPSPVRELVEFLSVPLQSDKGVAPEELIRIELSNRDPRFKED